MKIKKSERVKFQLSVGTSALLPGIKSRLMLQYSHIVTEEYCYAER